MNNVEIFRESELGLDDVLEVAADHVVIATGAHWRADGFGRYHTDPMADPGPAEQVFTPDDIMAGRLPEGPTIIFDDDHYYMACVIAERLRMDGVPVTLVTTEDRIAAWAEYTVERVRSQKRLMALDVEIVTAHGLQNFDGGKALIRCGYTGRERLLPADAVVMVTARQPNDALFRALAKPMEAGAEGAPRSLSRIGDCEAPAIIAAAVFSGHRYARELDAGVDGDAPLRRDRWSDTESGPCRNGVGVSTRSS